MKMKRLRLRNFMGYRDADVPLADLGLVGIGGDNGDGKSTLFNAVAWCLYEQTDRNGLPADDVINHHVGRDCLVRVDFDELSVVRYRKHGEFVMGKQRLKGSGLVILSPSGELVATGADANDKLRQLLQVDWTTFSNTLYLSQTAIRMFGDCTDAERKAILEQVLGLTQVSEALERAKEGANAVQQTISRIEGTRHQAQRTRQEALASLQRLQRDREVWIERQRTKRAELQANSERYEANREEALSSLGERLSQAEDSLRDMEARRGPLRTEEETIQGFEANLQAALERVESCRLSLHEVNTAYLQSQRTAAAASARATQARQHASSVGHLEGNCPTCFQAVSADALEAERERRNGEIASLVAAELSSAQAERTAQERLLAAQEAFREADEHYRNLRDGIAARRAALRQETASLEAELARSSREVESLSDQIVSRTNEANPYPALIETLSGEVCPYDGIVAQEEDRITTADRDIANSAANLEREQGNLAEYKFWVDGFGRKGLGSLIMETSIPHLNARANEYLRTLTDGRFSLQVSATTEGSTGRVREAIDIRVLDPLGNEMYRKASGGQRQLVDVAILLALRDLAAGQSPVLQWGVAFYDEKLFHNVNAANAERVVRLLRQEAQRFGTILAITHNPWLADLFPRMMTAYREGNTSKIRLPEGLTNAA